MSLSLVRSERRFERFDETFLSARTEVRILVRALLGEMPELSLHCLDRRAACDRLARHRMPTHLVVAEQTESELALHELERSHVAVDVTREVAGLREEKLSTGVPSSYVPIDRSQNVRREIER